MALEARRAHASPADRLNSGAVVRALCAALLTAGMGPALGQPGSNPTSPTGAVVTVSGSCVVRASGARSEVRASKGLTVRAGDRIVCRPGGSVLLRLPGSGEVYRIVTTGRAPVEYEVPAAQSVRSPSDDHRGGRTTDAAPRSIAGEELRTAIESRPESRAGPGAQPAPRLASVEDTHAAGRGLAGAVGNVMRGARDAPVRPCTAPLGTLTVLSAGSSDDTKDALALFTQMAEESKCFAVATGPVPMPGASSRDPRDTWSASARPTADYVLALSARQPAGAAAMTGARASDAAMEPSVVMTELRLLDGRSGAVLASGVVVARDPAAGRTGRGWISFFDRPPDDLATGLAQSFNHITEVVGLTQAKNRVEATPPSLPGSGVGGATPAVPASGAGR